MDFAALLAKLDQKLERIVAYLEEVGVSALYGARTLGLTTFRFFWVHVSCLLPRVCFAFLSRRFV